MKAKIEIECDDEEELVTHLEVIVSEIKDRTKQFSEAIEEKTTIYDNNCYGLHVAKITP